MADDDVQNPFTLDEEIADEPIAVEKDLDGTAEAAGSGGGGGSVERSVEGLIPLCALHPSGPHLQASVFGYDIAQMAERPWAKPGVNLADYFNYGFNEDSWRAYCRMMSQGEDSLQLKTAQYEEMRKGLEAMMASSGNNNNTMDGGGGGYSSMAPAPPGALLFGGGAGGLAGGGPPGSFPSSAMHKTRLCVRYQEGRCTRGEACTFAHGAGELRAPPSRTQQGFQHHHHGNQQQQQQQLSGGPPPVFPLAPPPPPMETGGVLAMPSSGFGLGGLQAPPQLQQHSNGPERHGRFAQAPALYGGAGGGGFGGVGYSHHHNGGDQGPSALMMPAGMGGGGFRMPVLPPPPAAPQSLEPFPGSGDDVYEPKY
jgi:hypothetical protein